MSWKVNQYYPLAEAQKEALQVASALLQAYPLTRDCLKVLGQDLLDQLEFGFFQEDFEIIQQGASGRDMFMMCSGVVDIVVNAQTLLQMQAPTLVGDKGLVEAKSKRAATIRVAKKETALFIKIPMGVFIRNFADASILDEDFSKEVQIFSNLFHGIQERLFHFIYLQKNLWEQVNTTLTLMNIQMIAKNLDKKKEMGWNETVWSQVKVSILQELDFQWPESIPLNHNTCREVLYKVLERKFPKTSFKGTEDEYLRQLILRWRETLTNLSTRIFKKLPEDSLPFQLEDIELFNPRNYHMRMSTLLKNIEKKFLSTVQHLEDQTLEIKKFFGTGEKANEFHLKQYLLRFSYVFEVPRPHRTQAQLAQKVAMIAAECENQFNTSVVKMQKFMDKVQGTSKSLSSLQSVEKQEKKVFPIQKYLSVLTKGFQSFEKTVYKLNSNIKEVRIFQDQVPSLERLVKTPASKATRVQIREAFKLLMEHFNVRKNVLPMSFLEKKFHIFHANYDDVIPLSELQNNYWIPLSHGIHVMLDSEKISTARAGCIYGGESWGVNDDKEKKHHLHFKVRTRNQAFDDKNSNYYFLLIFRSTLPWRFNQDPDEQELNQHLPLMQWLVNQYLSHFLLSLEERDIIAQKLAEVEKIANIEKKVQEFETNKFSLHLEQQKSIAKLLKHSLGMQIDVNTVIHSEQLAKKIYNFLLRRMSTDYPSMAVEERSNKAYYSDNFFPI